MSRFCLTLIAVLAVSAIAAGSVMAAESGETSFNTLSAYLHRNRLPLVEARMITGEGGERSVMLYGFVATDYGKRDAEDQARDFLDDPDIEIINRIKVRPELLTLGTRQDSPDTQNSAESPNRSGTDNGAQPADLGNDDGVDDSAVQAAAQSEDFPDQLGDREAYANQQRDEEALMSNGAVGGIPLALLILGSGGAMFPPLAPPLYGVPRGLPPYYVPPPTVLSPPPVIVMHSFGPSYNPYRGFPAGPGTFPSPFPAGPTPMFPATGGVPPFSTGPGFGSFPGFHAGFGSGFSHGGFGGGFGHGGFGGHR